MAVNEPIDPLVRLAISQWPDDAPRGAVSTFCAKHGIPRKSFYELRKRAKTDGPAAVLEPRTRRPKSSPSKLSDGVKEQAVAVRAALEASGLDHGPLSVHTASPRQSPSAHAHVRQRHPLRAHLDMRQLADKRAAQPPASPTVGM